MKESDSLLSPSGVREDALCEPQNDGSIKVDNEDDQKGSLLGASLNITNAIIGAGCIGYGGATANSGGLASIVLICAFALLTKLSCDLIIDLGLRCNCSSYEALGIASYGRWGEAAVMISKALFSFGCMVSYLMIIRDNLVTGSIGLFSAALGNMSTTALLLLERVATILVSVVAIFPLSLLTDMTPLEKFSTFKVILYGGIVLIVAYLYWMLPSLEDENEHTTSWTFFQKWFEIRPGVIESMGTFNLAFVGQHAIHLVYRSLPVKFQSAKAWNLISTISILQSLTIFIGLAVFPYMTYWDKTESNLLEEYPAIPVVDVARVLLSVAMVLTYPMPLLSLREIIAELLFKVSEQEEETETTENFQTTKQPWTYNRTSHIALTAFLLSFSLALALLIGSLGNILNLNGCISGSLIGFLLPALFSIRLVGFTFLSIALLLSGSFVGIVGSYYTLRTMLS